MRPSVGLVCDRERGNEDRLWRSPPSRLDLSACQVHVWRASLDVSESCLRDLRDTLSADEWSRAARLAFERDRRRFIAARGVLRVILGRYIGTDPSWLQFSYGQWGKPFLSGGRSGSAARESDTTALPDGIGPPDGISPHFNLSHSDGLALYAVARQRVGIDLERIRPVPEADDISRRFFSAREHAAYRALPLEARPKVFCETWTRCEAYCKALGVGLWAVRNISPARWSFHDPQPGPGYVATLAVEGGAARLACWQFDLW